MPGAMRQSYIRITKIHAPRHRRVRLALYDQKWRSDIAYEVGRDAAIRSIGTGSVAFRGEDDQVGTIGNQMRQIASNVAAFHDNLR